MYADDPNTFQAAIVAYLTAAGCQSGPEFGNNTSWKFAGRKKGFSGHRALRMYPFRLYVHFMTDVLVFCGLKGTFVSLATAGDIPLIDVPKSPNT